MRRTLLLLSALAAALALAPVAGADPPTKTPTPQSDFTLSGICAFDVHVTVLSSNGFFIDFGTGRAVAAGRLKWRLTNISNPAKTLSVNISGPGTYHFFEDGSVRLDAYGPWIFFFFPGTLGPGSPGILMLTIGHTVLTADAAGLAFTPARNSTDLCAALA